MSLFAELFGPVVLAGVAAVVFFYWRRAMTRHQRSLKQLDVRIHVNGIRGKSTVTRLVAAMLREAGYVTVAKTTGSAARVITPDGFEEPIFRGGSATINEQVDIVREYVTPDVEALVIECMAVNPVYQQFTQDAIVRSDITIITNVREDHQDLRGETLEEIADALSHTIPKNGMLITSEDRAPLRDRLRRNAEERGARFIYADAAWVTEDDMRGFDYLQFKTNVAAGLAIAHVLGIPREVAIRAMWKAVPDVGAVKLFHYDIRGKEVLWVPLFAVNDRESVMLTFEVLQSSYPDDATVIGILNNRADRGRRAEEFAKMVPRDLARFVHRIITFGAYEPQVRDIMVSGGYPAASITFLGESAHPTLDQILETIASLIPGKHGVLVGLVNIHTHQAELLLDYFEKARRRTFGAELEEWRKAERMPLPARRHRLAVAQVASEAKLRE
jgi:poly-gamma-glutamate synthase PgsB/CapB